MTFKKINVLGASLAIVGMATFVPAAQAQDEPLGGSSLSDLTGSISSEEVDATNPEAESTPARTEYDGDQSNYAQCEIKWTASAQANEDLPNWTNNGFMAKTNPKLFNPKSLGAAEMQHYRLPSKQLVFRLPIASLTDVNKATVTMELPDIEGATIDSAVSSDWFHLHGYAKADLPAGNVPLQNIGVDGNTVTADIPELKENSYSTLVVTMTLPEDYKTGPDTVASAEITGTQGGDCKPEEEPLGSLPGSSEGSSDVTPGSVAGSIAGSIVAGGIIGAIAGNAGSSDSDDKKPDSEAPSEESQTPGESNEAAGEDKETPAKGDKTPAKNEGGEKPTHNDATVPEEGTASHTPATTARGVQLANTGISTGIPAMLILAAGLVLAGTTLLYLRRKNS